MGAGIYVCWGRGEGHLGFEHCCRGASTICFCVTFEAVQEGTHGCRANNAKKIENKLGWPRRTRGGGRRFPIRFLRVMISNFDTCFGTLQYLAGHVPSIRATIRTSSSSHCMELSPFASSIEISAAASPLSSVSPRARCVFSSRSSTPDTTRQVVPQLYR